MFKNITEALEFIEQHHEKTSQENFEAVLKKHHNYEKELKTIHITGTNGKGSTSKMISDILIKANYKVGLFTSPHMVVANERIRINNQNINDQDLLYWLNFFYSDIIQFELNFFQIYVLIGLYYFYHNQVDIAVIEVGIGGRLDATNVINSLISIITNINYDHTQRLGNSLEEIAFEKSGIIKSNNTTITAVESESLLSVISAQSIKNNSELVVLKPINSKKVKDKITFKFLNKQYTLSSKAYYQAANAQVALMAVKVLEDKYGYKINEVAKQEALNEFTWIGRFEQVANNPNIILDGAHNIAGIKALIKSANKKQKYVVIFSALRDKDYPQMLNLLIDNFDEVVFCQFDFYRGLEVSELDEFAIKKFLEFNQALDYLKSKYPDHDILVCGSLYFISEIRKTLVR